MCVCVHVNVCDSVYVAVCMWQCVCVCVTVYVCQGMCARVCVLPSQMYVCYKCYNNVYIHIVIVHRYNTLTIKLNAQTGRGAGDRRRWSFRFNAALE